MANANISHVTLNNTFSDWRGVTNDLANSANDLRNGNYLREAGAVLNIKNGVLYVDRQTGVTLNVTANANVENNLTTKTKIVLDEAVYNGDDARFTNTNVIVQIANTLATKNLISNSFIHSQNTTTTDLIVGSDSSGMCWIQGDPYPSKTPIYIEGNFGAIDRGFNLYGNSISSVIVTANVANTKILDIDIDVQVPDGPGGVKGQKGQKGQPGVQGAQGVQGFAGLSGNQGVQGAQGLAGLKGDVGEIVGGTKGAKGDKGEFGYGEVGDDGEKGQKGESIGATKGEKGAKGDKGGLGDAGVNASTPSKGDTGDSGLSGDIGDVGLNVEFVRAYANFGGGFIGFDPTILSSNNVSSITLRSYSQPVYVVTVFVYTINFATPLTDANYAVMGSARKPNSSETTYYKLGSGHLQVIDKTANYVEVAYGLSGNYGKSTSGPTRYYVSQDASVIVVGNIVAASPVQITNQFAQDLSKSGIGGTGTATYRLNSTGAASRTNISGSLVSISGEWLVSGTASDFDVYATWSAQGGGDGYEGGGSIGGDTPATWLNLGTLREFTLSATNNYVERGLTVQIRYSPTATVVDTAVITFEVDSAP